MTRCCTFPRTVTNPSHSFLLASSLLFLPGLLGLARSGLPLSRAARGAAWVAVAASVVLIVESIPHLAAAFDETAVLAGQPTPFLTGHLVEAVIAYPLFGFSVAALAVLSGRSLAHPIIGVLGAIGAVAWGFTPVAVGPLANDALGVLFSGGLLLAAWFYGDRRARPGAEPVHRAGRDNRAVRSLRSSRAWTRPRMNCAF